MLSEDTPLSYIDQPKTPINMRITNGTATSHFDKTVQDTGTSVARGKRLLNKLKNEVRQRAQPIPSDKSVYVGKKKGSIRHVVPENLS